MSRPSVGTFKKTLVSNLPQTHPSETNRTEKPLAESKCRKMRKKNFKKALCVDIYGTAKQIQKVGGQ